MDRKKTIMESIQEYMANYGEMLSHIDHYYHL